MSYVLIHHTGCGTSRKGLELLRENGIEPELRKYMNASERLSATELNEIATQMDASPRDFLRDKDAAKFDIPADMDDAALFEAMSENPKLIQRPIGIHKGKAVLGRPVERLLDIA